jgi:porin
MRINPGLPPTLLLTCVTLLVTPQARAQTQSDWLNWQGMTGDWGGLRPQLKQDGITIKGDYVSEVSGNPVGGVEQGGAYAHEIMLGADIDSTLAGWNGGTLHAIITERAGSSLSKDKIGNILTVQEIYGDGQTVRITQLSYEQKLFGGALDVEAGRINTENNFATSPKYFGNALYCNYQSNAICGTPIAAPINSNGYVAYPASAWGGRVQITPTSHAYIAAGAYEVNPTLYLATNGFKLGTSGDQGVFTTVEAGLTPDFLGLDDKFRVGAYYDNSDNRTAVGQVTRFLPANSPILTAVPFETRAGRNGGWVLLDQQFEKEPNNRGTAAFANVQWGDHQTALITWFAETGLVRQGTFPGRDLDSAAIGFAIANLNGTLENFERAEHVPATEQEFVLETNYGAALGKWLMLRPGIQYVWHPAGEAERRNALVIDLKTTAAF